MKPNSVYVHKETKKELSIKTPDIVAPAEYPSDWFKDNKAKPSASYVKGGITEDQLIGVVKDGIEKSELSVGVVKYFIYNYFKTVTEELTAPWTSFGVSIGKKGDKITPWDIIDVKMESGTHPNVTTTGFTKEDASWLICICLAAHRLNGITNETYQNALRDRIGDQIKLMGSPLRTYPPKSLYDTWTLDRDYNRMIAAIDMFLYKFPKTVSSVYRICTLRSRYRDCAALLSLSYITNLLNMRDESDIIDWFYTEKLGLEATQMMDVNQEVLTADSYFPYQSDLSLVQKTYYSASKNPHLYFVIHAVGTLLQTSRSKNARFLSDYNIVNNTFNAKVIAFAFHRNVSLEKLYYKKDYLPEDPIRSEQQLDDLPTSTNGTEWFNYLTSLDYRLPKVIVDTINDLKSKIGDVREGTIGEYVKEHF